MSARRLRVELAPSAFLTIGLTAAHAAAAAAVLAVMPGVAGVLLAGLVVALGAAGVWSRALHRSASSVKVLDIGANGLEIELGSGARLPATMAERRYVGRHFVLLPLRSPVRRTVLVTRDMTDADAFRRLRIWALWGKLSGVAGKQLAA